MHYHILGIAGTMTTPIAVDLVSQGHVVTGSDQEKIYPPVSTIIAENKITVNPDFPIADQYIIGSSYKAFERCRQEFQLITDKKLPYLSATEFVAQNVVKDNSILIAGSYGKSTISTLLTWVLIQNNFDPSYFFGAQSINKMPSLKTNNSSWSVVEADESINGLDTQAKFLYYPVKYLILTSADWEHKDSYKTESENYQAFKKLVENIPVKGLLVYNQNNPSALELAKFCRGSSISYVTDKHFESPLIGQHNQENISAVFTLCSSLGIEESNIISAIKSFAGIKRRLERIPSKDVTIIDDFAQSPLRIKSSMDTIKQQFPDSKIYVYFEPHASFLQSKSGLSGLGSSLQSASKVFLGQIKFNPGTSKDDRVTARDYQMEIGDKLSYQPIKESIFKEITSTLNPGDVLVHFSSGGLDGINLIQDMASFFRHK